MLVRKLVAPVAILVALLGLPSAAEAAPIPVTVTVTGAQTYGGSPTFAGKTGVTGLTVSGVTCTGLSDGAPIAPTLPALGAYTLAGGTCSGGTLSNPGYVITGYSGSTHTVSKALLTVNAENRTKVYGEANPAFGYGLTGFVNGDDASAVTGAPALTTTATATSDVGSYPITPSLGTLKSSNYRFAAQPGTLSVTPKPVRVEVFGAQNYGGEATFGTKTGVPGLTASGVTCTGLRTGETISASLPFGNYLTDPTTCSGGVLSSSNYSIESYTSSWFAVFKAALTVTATDASRHYGEANPALDYTITGFVNGDDASAVTGAPSLTTTATATSDVGDYPITAAVGTLKSANYKFIYVPGTLEVTPKPVKVEVFGAQNYGGEATFGTKTGIPGLTVSGVTCTGLKTGETISASLPFGNYLTDPTTCSGGVLSSSNYSIDSYTSSWFAVFKAALTVTATDVSRHYGEVNPALDYTITGFVNGDDASAVTGAPSLATTATKTSDVGDYPINPGAGTLKSANYKFVYAPGTLEVTPKPVKVEVFGAQNYGGEATFGTKTGIPGLTASGVTCTGLKTGETVSASLPFGNYLTDPTTCSGGVLSSANYTIDSYTSSWFAVFKAALTVTATDVSRRYGVANPALDYTITGFVNGEDASAITGAPSLATTATTTSDVGEYPITAAVGTLKAANYKFVFVPGSLTVNKRLLLVAADPATRAYGENPPTYTATFTGFRNGDTAASLSGAPVFSTTATSSSAPGSYPLSVAEGTLAATNYAFTGFTSSTLTIVKATPTVTTTAPGGKVSATVTYGSANTPVVGSTITFTIGTGTTVTCTAVTDATGKAQCTPPGLDGTKILLQGYTARFPGTANVEAASRHQGLVN